MPGLKHPNRMPAPEGSRGHPTGMHGIQRVQRPAPVPGEGSQPVFRKNAHGCGEWCSRRRGPPPEAKGSGGVIKRCVCVCVERVPDCDYQRSESGSGRPE